MSTGKRNFDNEYVATIIMLTCFKFGGLAPFSIRRSTQRKHSKMGASQDFATIKFSSSPSSCVYNLCLVAVYIGVLFVSIPIINNAEYLNKSPLTVAIEATGFQFGNGVLFITWLLFGFRQKTAARLLNRLLSIDGATIYVNDNHRLESSSSFIFFLSLIFIAIWMGRIFTTFLAFDFSIFAYLGYILASAILSWYVIQYTFIVKLLENRFKTVNRALLNRSIPSSPDIPHGLFLARSVSDNDFPAPKIAILRRAYINLCDIASEVSDFYSVPILLTIAFSSFGFLYNTYYLVVPLVTIMDTPSYMILVNTLFEMISQILPIVMLALGVTNAARETSKTGDIVWNLLTIFNSRHDDNDELELFSLELLHRNIQFSACGLFSLDLTIVHSIFSMVFTYLIILIQFQM